MCRDSRAESNTRKGWEGWVLAGTSMGLTYNEPREAPKPGDPPGMFLNVYIQPWAYDEAFVQFYPKIRERLGMESPAEAGE